MQCGPFFELEGYQQLDFGNPKLLCQEMPPGLMAKGFLHSFLQTFLHSSVYWFCQVPVMVSSLQNYKT